MKTSVSILSFDLGANLGWSKSIANIKGDLGIKTSDHGTINLNMLASTRMKKDHNSVYNKHRFRMIVFEEHIRRLINLIKFDCFVVEDVFCQFNRINAYKALLLYMDTLERVVNQEKGKTLYRVTPTLIKKHITSYGQANKLEVQRALLDCPDIEIKNPESLTEHSSDAIACTYALSKEIFCYNEY